MVNFPLTYIRHQKADRSSFTPKFFPNSTKAKDFRTKNIMSQAKFTITEAHCNTWFDQGWALDQPMPRYAAVVCFPQAKIRFGKQKNCHCVETKRNYWKSSCNFVECYHMNDEPGSQCHYVMLGGRCSIVPEQ